MPRGLLITIEGLDGAGKSTLAEALGEQLRARGHDAQVVREPGGVALSEQIRALVTDPRLAVAPRAEALLYAAARAQLTEQLLAPSLAAGTLLVLDRFADSSLAYQGAGRGLGIETVRALNDFATGRLTPDLTLLLAVSPAVGRSRRAGAPDRIEGEQEPFFNAVAEAYSGLAEAEPERFVTIDGEQAPGAVLEAALLAIDRLLERSARG